MGIAVRYMFIVFGPEVYFAIISGKIIFTTNIIVCMTIILSFGTPASMSFKIDALSVAANPIFNNISNTHYTFSLIKIDKRIKIVLQKRFYEMY